MALRAGLVALSTKLKTGSQRLWVLRTVPLDKLGTLNFMAESQIKVKFVMALASGKRNIESEA